MSGSGPRPRSVVGARWGVLVLVALAAWCACLQVCVAASFSRAAVGVAQPPRTPGGQHIMGTYCGGRLVDALKFLCQGQYNSYFKPKRTPPPPPPPPPPTPPAPGNFWAPPVQLPFRDRLRAAALLESKTRVTRGVYDECCTKACTFDELMSYCDIPD